MIKYDIICFSHLRWSFVFQRPQHLMSHFSAHSRVFFIEEPIFDSAIERCQVVKDKDSNVFVVTPHFPSGIPHEELVYRQQLMLTKLMSAVALERYILWCYTPMALPYTEQLEPIATVYDCMDELSAFKGAPPELVPLEELLMKKADIVFTGGASLYEAKKNRHPNIFAFPSSIDKSHFSQARTLPEDPDDQKHIPTPRLGFYGVIDERFDIQLVQELAVLRPDLHQIFIGPIVKIDSNELPQAPNIHYLGARHYKELPAYLAQWDIAIMPFALNDSTRYISPTKTPEFLAGGKPVISTAIRDVVTPYGDDGMVYIAHTAQQFSAAADEILKFKSSAAGYRSWLSSVDSYLEGNSWTSTCNAMEALIDKAIKKEAYNVKIDTHV
jgi:hypothetical protein